MLYGRCCVTGPSSRPAVRLDIFIEILPTVTLSIIALRSVDWSTVIAFNIGHFGASFGSKRGVSRLLNGSLSLSVTVGYYEVP